MKYMLFDVIISDSGTVVQTLVNLDHIVIAHSSAIETSGREVHLLAETERNKNNIIWLIDHTITKQIECEEVSNG